MPRSSRMSGLPVVLCYRGVGRSVHLAAPYQRFPQGFRKSFRAPLEGPFSKSISSVMAKVLWKLWDVRKRPQTFETAPTTMLHSSRASGLPGVLCSWGGARLPWPRHPCFRNYGSFENVQEVSKLPPLECHARIVLVGPLRALGTVPQGRATRLPWPRAS